LETARASDAATLLAAALAWGEDPIRRLQIVRAVRPMLDEIERWAWRDARELGHSWRELGDALGIGKSGAQMRSAGLKRAADERRVKARRAALAASESRRQAGRREGQEDDGFEDDEFEDDGFEDDEFDEW
jgi:hypothetical protein